MNINILNEDIIQLFEFQREKVTMTKIEVIVKTLLGDDTFKKFISDKFKAKLPTAKVDYVKAVVSQPLAKAKELILFFIKKVMGVNEFNSKFNKILEPMHIVPLEWS